MSHVLKSQKIRISLKKKKKIAKYEWFSCYNELKKDYSDNSVMFSCFNYSFYSLLLSILFTLFYIILKCFVGLNERVPCLYLIAPISNKDDTNNIL